MRRGRWVAVLLVALVTGCADTGAPTTPTKRVPPQRHRPAQGARARPGGRRPGPAAGHLPLPVPGPAARLRRPHAEAMFLGGRPDQPPPAWTVRLAGPGPDPTNVEGVAFSWGGHDLNLLAENRDVFFVPAGAYER
jgi:hypothetical protein